MAPRTVGCDMASISEAAIVETERFGHEPLADPTLNKGTAFTERECDEAASCVADPVPSTRKHGLLMRIATTVIASRPLGRRGDPGLRHHATGLDCFVALLLAATNWGYD